MRNLFLALAIVLLSACSFVGFPGVYKIDVEQGNIITQDIVDQLKPGMSRRQVRFILGTPLLEDTFNSDRWDYLYTKRNGPDLLNEAHLSIVFEDDALSTVTGDYMPENWPGSDASDDAASDAAIDSTGDADSDTEMLDDPEGFAS